MSGAGIMLLAEDRPRGSVCTTDEVSAQIEELQYTLGEGPCVDAHRHHAPVIEPDLASPGLVRWAAFSRSAVAAGARAVFGFPVAVGDIRVGALNLYRDRPGPLTADQHADALVVAEVAARSIIAMQADAVPGELGAGARGWRKLPFRCPPGRRHGRRAARRPGRRGPAADPSPRLQHRRDGRRRRRERSSPDGFGSILTTPHRSEQPVVVAPAQAHAYDRKRDREPLLPLARPLEARCDTRIGPCPHHGRTCRQPR